MTEPHRHAHLKPTNSDVNGAFTSLDGLLLNLPTPGGEPTPAEWAARLEGTLNRLSTESTLVAAPETELLRTPLPVEAGEPDAEQSAPQDPLRAPLKSGEHAPVRLEPRLEEPVIDAPSLLDADVEGASSDGASLADSGVDGANARGTRDTPLPNTPRARHWAYWLSTGVGVLAAAAALVIATRGGETVDLGQDLAPAREARKPAFSPMASVAATAKPEEIPPSTSIAELESVQARPTEPVVAKPALRAVSAAAARSPATPSKLGGENAAAEPVTPDEHPLVPAAGPSNLAERPSLGALSAALASSIPLAQRCLTPELPSVGVRIVFQSSGSVQSVQASATHIAAEVRNCLERAFSRAHVEPFAQPRVEVTRMISLPTP